MRHLASIKTIRELNPITGADKIERAVIDGYDCVVKKGQFQVGDLCVYFENDSILPNSNPDFAFLEGKRIRIKRLRGVYSYGIAFPMSILPRGYYGDGDDVTEVLGVKKWEPEVISRGKHNDDLIRVPYPGWIPKTDETRFQNLIDILKDYEGTECYITEKLDGTSTTHWLDDDGNYHLASRNREIVDKSEIFYRGALAAHIPELLANFPKTVLQGELIGPGISKNRYKLDDYKIYMFNLFSMETMKFVSMRKAAATLEAAGFDVVPIIHHKWRLVADKDKLLELSMGKSKLNPSQHREGIVIRPIEEKFIDDPHGWFTGGRLSFKVINPKFELEN